MTKEIIIRECASNEELYNMVVEWSIKNKLSYKEIIGDLEIVKAQILEDLQEDINGK